MNKKILICGASGQLGSALKKQFSSDKKFKVYGLSRSGNEDFQCSITDSEALKKVFDKIQPSVVINSAAFVHADLCEEQKEKCYNINYFGNKNLLELSKKVSSYFIFISSYYVYDGEKKEYKETDVPYPQNFYGMTKLMSEIETDFGLYFCFI